MQKGLIDVIDDLAHVFIHKTTSELTVRTTLVYPLGELKETMKNRGFEYVSPLWEGNNEE